MGKLKNAQSGIELVVLVGIGLLFALIIVNVSSSEIQSIFSSNEYIAARDLAFRLQKELAIASQVDEGYVRKFDLPKDINGIDYSVNISSSAASSTLVVKTENYEQVLYTPKSQGQFIVGQTNQISKMNKTIYIN